MHYECYELHEMRKRANATFSVIVLGAVALFVTGCGAVRDAKRNKILRDTQTYERFNFDYSPVSPASQSGGEMVVVTGNINLGVRLGSKVGTLRVLNMGETPIRLMIDESAYFYPFGRTEALGWFPVSAIEGDEYAGELSRESIVVLPKQERKVGLCLAVNLEKPSTCWVPFTEISIRTEESWDGSLRAAALYGAQSAALESERRVFGVTNYAEYRKKMDGVISLNVGKTTGFDFAMSLGGEYKVVPLRFVLGQPRSLGVFNRY